MPIPIAQTLFQQIFGSSLPTASLTKPTETSDQEGEDVVRRGPAISFQDVLTRQFLGPAILPKTIDTPLGKVFAPDDPIPAKPDILATYPEKEKETKIISSPMPAGEPQGLMGLPIPETQDKLKGFQTPILPNFNVLNKKLNELPEKQVDKFLEKQDFLYDDDYEIFLRDDQKKLKQGIIPENKKYTSNDLIERYGKYEPIHKYWEEEWAGGIGDLGSRLAGEIMRSGGMQQTESGLTAPSYYEDYKFKLQDLARKELGKDFIGYRLMSKAEMDDLLNEGNAAFDVKSYSLKKKSALGFKHFTNKAFIDMETGEPRADLVLAEAPLDVEGLVMRGNSNESEIVYDNQFVNPEQMNFYDLNGKLIKGAQSGFLTEDKKESTPVNVPVGNQIKTWEHLTLDKSKAEEIAKQNNISFKELERLAIKDQITFKKKGRESYDIYFDGKFIGELDNITKGTSGEVPKTKYGDAYNINLIDRSLNTDNVDTQNGLNYSKEKSKDIIANSLLDLDKNNEYSLRSFFTDIKYDKKGNIISQFELEKKTSNPVGSLIDKPLSDETN